MYTLYVRHAFSWLIVALLIFATSQPDIDAWKDLSLPIQFFFYFFFGLVIPFYIVHNYVYIIYSKTSHKKQFWVYYTILLVFYILLSYVFIRTIISIFFSIPFLPSTKAVAQSFYIILVNTIVSSSVAAFMVSSRMEYQVKEKLIFLENEKTIAEYNTLKSQFDPHFLFNTLNNIYFQIDDGNLRAKKSIEQLSTILRYIIYDCRQNLVTIEKEISLVQNYCQLQQIRYGEDTKIICAIGRFEPKCLIPPLLIIPLVENAFKHSTGISKGRDFLIHIDIHDDSGEGLFIKVQNHHIAKTASTGIKEGVGLSNLKKRLSLLYGKTDMLQYYYDEGKELFFSQIYILYENKNDHSR